jgi:AcrR family transcriptional regulator
VSDLAHRRPYDAPRRRAKAKATRQAILDSARQLFTADGILATTVTAIAREASVSPQTVYALFRSKAGVLLALLDELEHSVDATARAAAIESAASAHEQLELIVAFHCDLFERGLDVVEVVRRTSSHPEVRPAWEEGQRRRRAACEVWVRQWDRAGALRPGLRLGPATDLLWLHCGDDVYCGLAMACGWDREEVQRWLVETLGAQLLAPTSDRHPTDNPVTPK